MSAEGAPVRRRRVLRGRSGQPRCLLGVRARAQTAGARRAQRIVRWVQAQRGGVLAREGSGCGGHGKNG